MDEHKLRYAQLMDDFNTIINLGIEVSDRCVGLTEVSERLYHGDTVFAKLITHAVTLSKLMPVEKKPQSIWDISSACAIARCIIDSFDTLSYIYLQNLPEDELEFRILFWHFHDAKRRVQMLEKISSTDIRREDGILLLAKLRAQVETHQIFLNFDEAKKKMLLSRVPHFHLTDSERCLASKIDIPLYGTAQMFLSQYVHTFPFAVQQLHYLDPNENSSIRLMAMPIRYCIPFVARAVESVIVSFPEKAGSPAVVIPACLAIWSGIASTGFTELPKTSDTP